MSSSERGAVGNIVAVVLGGAAGAGLLVGALLGLTGTASLVGEPASLADAAVASFYDCPDGAALGTVTRGDRVLITGRDASGDWAEIRSPLAPNSRVWMRAAQVLPDGATGDLPVLACNVPVEAFAATVTTATTEAPDTTATTEAPDTTATTQAPPPTTGTTAPPPTTGTTEPPADTTPPAIGQQQANPGQIWELDGQISGFDLSCPGVPHQSTVSATVTDGGGIATVIASWSDPAGGHSVGMSASGNTYSTTVGPYAAGAWDPLSNSPYDHTFAVTITARDTSGNESSTSVNVTAFEIGECAFG